MMCSLLVGGQNRQDRITKAIQEHPTDGSAIQIVPTSFIKQMRRYRRERPRRGGVLRVGQHVSAAAGGIAD